MYRHLLEPLQIKNMKLKNRIFFPPMTTGYEERDGSISQRSLDFYERLAKGGTAYIVVGDVAPVRTASPTPMLYDDTQIPAFEKLAEAVHRHDSRLGLQIFHPEYDVPGVGRMIGQALGMRQAAAKADPSLKAALSAKAEELTRQAYAKLHHDMAHFATEATVEQLSEIKEKMAACAARAQKAGVDAIEIHGDRLLGSLCSKALNHRQDEYGGSLENRTRFALEVVDAMAKAAPELVIEYKLPIVTVNEDGSLRGKGGLEIAEAVEFARMLEKAGVDLIQTAQANHTGNMKDTIPPMGDVETAWVQPCVKAVKEAVTIPVAAVGKILTLAKGEEILAAGQADLIGYGRSLLADPDLGAKAANERPVRHCLNCNKGCVDAISSRRYISCVLNAENGNEGSMKIEPAAQAKKAAVVGGGLAGLEAARVAALKGHEVTLYEASAALGGQIQLAAVPPRKADILRSVAFFEEELPRLGVTILKETTPTCQQLNEYDAVIAATGASPMPLPFPVENSRILSSWDVLKGAPVEGYVVILGGGLVGTETAEHLAAQGHEVTIVEMMDKIAAGESSTVLPLIQASFARYNVKQMPNTKVSSIQDNVITACHTKEGTVHQIKADTIVNALGSVKNEFDGSGIQVPVYYAGDCALDHTADIAAAIRSGYAAGNAI